VTRTDGPGIGATQLARERKRVIEALEALDGQDPTGQAILRRLRERSTDAEVNTGDGSRPADQSLLYPALHSLEADWLVQAKWLPDANGRQHRTYRKRRLLPSRRGPARRS
jgi:DNA-binding PadR family transcriptional regulator